MANEYYENRQFFDKNKLYTVSLSSDGGIYHVTNRGQEQIGVDMKEFEEMYEAINTLKAERDEYKQILIENELLQIPKTPEEIVAENAERMATEQRIINQSLLDAISDLHNEIKELKSNGNNGRNNNENNSTDISDNVGQKNKRDKANNGTGNGNKQQDT